MSKVKHMDYGGASQKKVDMMRFTHMMVTKNLQNEHRKYF